MINSFGNLDVLIIYPTFSIFKSFGVNSFIIPSLNNHILKESSKIYNAQLPLINNKNDIERITINGILFGDLIYDYYLNYHKEPTIYTETKTFKRHLNYCIQLIVYWNNFFIDNDLQFVNGIQLSINHIKSKREGVVFATAK